MHIFFRIPLFDTLTNCQKIISHPYTLFVIFKMPKEHYKTGEKQAKKSWTKFWRNLGPSFDSKNPNRGPSFDSTTHTHIYIYAVMLLTGPRLAILTATNWATLIVTNWATSFSHYKNRGFRWFFWCSVISLCFFLFSVIFQLSKNSLFQRRGAKNVFFNFQCFK